MSNNEIDTPSTIRPRRATTTSPTHKATPAESDHIQRIARQVRNALATAIREGKIRLPEGARCTTVPVVWRDPDTGTTGSKIIVRLRGTEGWGLADAKPGTAPIDRPANDDAKVLGAQLAVIAGGPKPRWPVHSVRVFLGDGARLN